VASVPEHLLVDGYNVLHAWPEMRAAIRRSTDLARGDLVYKLLSYSDALGVHVTVVFDGNGPSEGEQYEYLLNGSLVEVIFSTKKKTADQVIERIIYRAENKINITVATSDRGIRDFAMNEGVRTIGSMALRELVDAK